MKRIIRLTENDLARIVKRVIVEEEMSLVDRKLLNKLQSQAKGCFNEDKYPCLYHTFQSMADMEISLGLFSLAALSSETIFGGLAFGGEGLAALGLSYAHLERAIDSKSDCFEELQNYLRCLGWKNKKEINWDPFYKIFGGTIKKINDSFMKDNKEEKPRNCSELDYPSKLTNQIIQDKKDGIIKDYSFSTKFSNFNPSSGFRPTSNPSEDPYNYIILTNGKYCSRKSDDTRNSTKYDVWDDATSYKTKIDRVIKDRKSFK